MRKDSINLRWIGGPIIAIGTLAWSFITLSYWTIKLNGIFREKNPDVEPAIFLLAIVVPFFLGFSSLICFYVAVPFRFIKEHHFKRGLGSIAIGIVVLTVFTLAMFIFAMAFS